MEKGLNKCCLGVICMPGGSGKSFLANKYPNKFFDIDGVWNNDGNIESRMINEWMEAKQNNDTKTVILKQNECVLYKAIKCRQNINQINKIVLAQSHEQAQILLYNRTFIPKNNYEILSNNEIFSEQQCINTGNELHLIPNNDFHLKCLKNRNDPQWIIDLCQYQLNQLKCYNKYITFNNFNESTNMCLKFYDDCYDNNKLFHIHIINLLIGIFDINAK